MATFNQVTFIGRLGKDPELNVTSEGTPYTRFSLAVDQGKDTPAMWLNVVCWKELAERTEQLSFKGAQVFVQGRLQMRSYKDKNKIQRVAVDIVASTIQLLEKRKQQAAEDDLPIGFGEEQESRSAS